jgi:hypothetical protein
MSHDHQGQDNGAAPRPWGYLVEFETVQPFVDATKRVRDEGFTRWDAYSPFPIHHMESFMGMRRTILPFVVLGGGITGASLGLLMQWWMNAVDYQLIISGKPLFSLPANIPIIFELTVLLSAFGAVFGMLAFNQLPELHHPLFNSERFKRVTTDRFFIAIEASDPRFDVARTRTFMNGLGGTNVELVEEG